MKLDHFTLCLLLCLVTSGNRGDTRGVAAYIGDDTGVKNLVVVARLRNPSMSFKVRLLCRVSSGFKEGTMLKPSKAENRTLETYIQNIRNIYTKILGPIVQSIVSLTSLLMTNSSTVVAKVFSNIFAAKM